MWELLGFKASPYDTRPLSAVAEDVEMLVGRSDEAVTFATLLDSRTDGVMVISGSPGVGKTSFLNVQQYIQARGDAPFGPRVLPAYQLTPINAGDSAEKVAHRVIESLIKSMEMYAYLFGKALPKQVTEVRRWLGAYGASGFDIGIQILGVGGNFGRTTEVPPLKEASFERLTDVISALASEAVANLGVKQVIVALDNIENLEDGEIQQLLMTCRDTLFSARNVWWVLIGQSGLGSFLRELDPRVADRVEGSGIELRPIALEELHEAVNRRIGRFTTVTNAQSPVPREVHQLLYETSGGEIRFVFKYANEICTCHVAELRARVMKDLKTENVSVRRDLLDKAIGDAIVKYPLTVTKAKGLLKTIVENELARLSLSSRELGILKKIGEKGSARGKEYREFGVNSNQQFSGKFLVPLHGRQLLTRSQDGRAVQYSLRGIAAVAHHYKLL